LGKFASPEGARNNGNNTESGLAFCGNPHL
jgi:hypothetical protein